MTLTLQVGKKKKEPFVVSTAEEPIIDGINLEEINTEFTKELESNVENKKEEVDSLTKEIDEKAPILEGIDFNSLKSIPPQELPSEQPVLDGIDLSFLNKSNPEAVLTQVAPGVISSKSLWSGAKDEDLIKIEYDDFDNLAKPDLWAAIREMSHGNVNKAFEKRFGDYEELFKLAAYQRNHPTPKDIPNPKKLLKAEPLLIAGLKDKYPSADELLSNYLEKKSPNLLPLLQNFRAETGRSFALPYGKSGRFENGVWEIDYQPTEGLIRSLNAYVKGGMEEYNSELKKINQENIIYTDTSNRLKKEIDDFAKDDRPWFGAWTAAINPILPLLSNSAAYGFKQGIVDGTAGSSLSKLHDYNYLMRALWTSAAYGMNSTEYDNLIEEDKIGRLALNEGIAHIRHGEGIIGKTAEGIGAGAGQLPYMLTARHSLPVLIYFENLHEGKFKAAGAAFGQLPFIGVGGLVGGKLGLNVIAKETEVGGKLLASRLGANLGTRAAQGATAALTDLWINQKEYALGTKSITDIIPEAVIGTLFPVGKIGKGHLNLSTRLESIKAQTSNSNESRATGSISVVTENQSESTQGSVELPLDLLALNLLEMRRSLVNKSYQKTKAFSAIGENLRLRSNIEEGVKRLEAIVPKHVVDFVAENEQSIRQAMRKGFEKNEARKVINESNEISEVDKVNLTNDNLDFLSQGRELFGEKGRENKFVNQGQAAKDIANVKADFKDTTSTSNLNDATSVLAYMARNTPRMARLGAFYIEAGIRDFSEFANRIKGDLGEELTGIFGEKRIQKLFEDGQKFYETNNADPFFSSFKQSVVERFPDKAMKAESAWALLQRLGNKNELEWTQGLSKFMQDAINDGRSISKKQILDIIQNGQIKVEEVILAKNASREEVDTQINNLVRDNKEFSDAGYDSYTAKTYYDLVKKEGLDTFANETDIKFYNATKDLVANIAESTRYDLKTYTSEKLELEGGKRPREVLLQVSSEFKLDQYTKIEKVESNNTYRVISKDINGERILEEDIPTYKEALELYGVKPDTFSGSHWNPYENVFAHFRANERSTIDGKKVFHSEEFQSDWNQQGRKEGYIRKERPYSNSEGLNNFVDNVVGREGNISQNPFMENSWKELAFKRFLRMGIEMGKDGITWTTSRQQQERYNKLLNSKVLEYRQNDDGTYAIVAITSDGPAQAAEMRAIPGDKLQEMIGPEFTKMILDSEGMDTGAQYKRISGEAINVIGKGYSDYDTYFANLAKKIGKKFGAEYKIKEIETSIRDISYRKLAQKEAIDKFNNNQEVFGRDEQADYNEYDKIQDINSILIRNPTFDNFYSKEQGKKVEQVYYLEITPSMRESILKKGQPLYGLDMESLPKSQEKSGIRNRIITLDEHSSILSELGEALNTESNSTGEVFNSGLNPEAFAQQIKLLYKGIKDFDEFTSTLTARFGDKITDYIEQLWNYTKAEVKDFKEGITWREEITSEAQAIINKRIENGEAGRFSLRKERAQSFEEFKERNFKDRVRMLGYAVSSGQTLAYFIPEFRQMYNRMREIRLQLEGYSNNLITNLGAAYKVAKNLDLVANTIYSGNAEQLVYTDAELQSGISRNGNVIPKLEAGDIQAYRILRAGQDAILRIRESQQIYKLQKTLSQQTAGSSEYIQTQDKIAKIVTHYNQLRESGYVSLQRRGKYAVYAEDVNFPEGDMRRKVYTHVKSEAEGNKLLLEHERRGYKYMEMKLIRNNFKNVGELAKKLTPSQLEDLLHASGVSLVESYTDPATGQIIKTPVGLIKEHVLSNYSSFGYQLKRDFTRGYKPTWNNLKDTLHHQLEVYSSSYYNNIGREEGMDRLNAAELLKYSITSKDSNRNNVTKLFDSKSEAEKYQQGLSGHTDIKLQYPNEPLYHTTKSYIEDETPSPRVDGIVGIGNRKLIQARQLTYLYQLAFDASQLVTQASQPFLITYPHLAKEVLTGLKGLQPEKVFIKSIIGTGLILKEGLFNTTLRRQNPKQSKALNLLFGVAEANEFRQIFTRAKAEDIVSAQNVRSLAENELNTGSKLNRINNFASIFIRKAELLNRTNALAAGFLAGKEKALSGNDLYNFAIDFVGQTQGTYTRGENPRVVRAFGEAGKLLYQFEKYTQIWFENLATAVHSDVKTSSHKILHGATVRHLGALGVIAGFSGYPLATLMRGLVTTLMQKDEKKDVEKQLEENLQYYLSLNSKSASALKNLALYGASGNAGVSERFGMEFPVLDNADKIITGDMDYSRSLPALSTGRQIVQGAGDLITGEDKARAIEDMSPRFAKNPQRAYRYFNEGVKDRQGDTIVSRSKISTIENALAVLGFQPHEVVHKRQDDRFKKLQEFARNNSRKIRRNWNLHF